MRSMPFVLVGVLFVSLVSAAVATPTFAAPNAGVAASVPGSLPAWPPTRSFGRRGQRLFGASPKRKSPRSVRGQATTTGWSIRDLGMPAGMAEASPTAINQRGDVAIFACPRDLNPGDGCGSSSTIYPYLYDASSARLLPLARLSTHYTVEKYLPNALNDRGVIVGTVVLGDGTSSIHRPVIWKRVGCIGSTVAYLDARPQFGGAAYAVNESGTIVGADGPSNSFNFPVRFEEPGPVVLSPKSVYSYGGDAVSVNDAGLAVGDLQYGPWIFDSPTGTPIPGLAYVASTTAINRAGNIVGNTYAVFPPGNSDMAVFFYTAKTATTSIFYVFNEANDRTTVTALNDLDEFVGYASTFDYRIYGPYLSSSGMLADLVPANAPLFPGLASGINNRHQIVGEATNLRPYLLEPTPSCPIQNGRCRPIDVTWPCPKPLK